jgi:hypothetical protein
MLRKLLGKSRAAQHSRPPVFRPRIEVLEDRWLPSSLLNSLPANPTLNVTTIPSNGDVNPYGVAFVPQNFATGGPLAPGDILVSNFNNSTNAQGKGTTIVSISPTGQTSTFFQGPAGLGLTTALGVLPQGFVIVGSVPTNSSGTAQQGSLLILNQFGKPVANLTNPALLDGPWDLTVVPNGNHPMVFVSNVLNGTVTRLDLTISGNKVSVQSATEIAGGYNFTTNPAALVLGPTGLAYDAQTGTLFVASTDDNAVFAIPNAATRQTPVNKGTLIFQNSLRNPVLQGPLGLALAPNGNLILTNGDAVDFGVTQPNLMVEITQQGKVVATKQVDPSTGGGAAFGLAINSSGNQVQVAAVDDATNTLEVWNTTFP